MGSLYSQSKNIIRNFFKDSQLAIGVNHSLYGSYWNDFMDEIDDSTGLDEVPYLNLNISLFKTYSEGLYGIKYISNGYKYNTEEDVLDSKIKTESEFEMSLLKFFFTNPVPVVNGIHFGLEAGFIFPIEIKYKKRIYKFTGLNSKLKSKFSNDSEVTQREEEIDFEEWTDELGHSPFEVGGLAQYFFDFTKNLSLGIEGYYSFISSVNNLNKEAEASGIPKKFHYLNFNLIYKF